MLKFLKKLFATLDMRARPSRKAYDALFRSYTKMCEKYEDAETKCSKLRSDLEEKKDTIYLLTEKKEELLQETAKLSADRDHIVEELRDALHNLETTEKRLATSGDIRSYLADYSIIRAIISGDWEKVYHTISHALDFGGWALYRAAQKYTGVNVSYAFPAEDNMGMFENADGSELLDWLETEAFGECDWELLNPPYERATNMRIHKDTEEYKKYRASIYRTAAIELLGLTGLPQKATVNIEGQTTANACAFKETAEMLAQAFNIDMDAEPETQPGEHQLFVDTFGFGFDEACNDSSEHFMLPQLSARYQQLWYNGQMSSVDAWSNAIQEAIEGALNRSVPDQKSA